MRRGWCELWERLYAPTERGGVLESGHEPLPPSALLRLGGQVDRRHRRAIENCRRDPPTGAWSFLPPESRSGAFLSADRKRSGLGSARPVPAPVPGFVGDPVGVLAGKRKVKPETRRVPFEPAKRRRATEVGLQIEMAGAADVQGAAGVVFAEAGRGDEAEDGIDAFAGGEFAADDFGLARDGAETGDRNQLDAILGGGGAHSMPGGGGGRSEAHGTPAIRLAADENEPAGFALRREFTRGGVVGRDAEPAVKRRERRGTRGGSRGHGGVKWSRRGIAARRCGAPSLENSHCRKPRHGPQRKRSADGVHRGKHGV